jgi:esterase/lipase
MQKISFQSNGLTIRGTFPGVIIFHGMTSSQTGHIPLAAILAENGIAGLAISMRGHDGSEGDFNKATVAEATNDAVAAYDFLVAQPGIDAARIGLVGSSVGAILSSLATEKRDIRSLVFRAPAAYTEKMMQLSMADTMTNESRQFHEIKQLKNTPAGHAIANFNGSLLVVASENDAIIPPVITRGYINIADKAKQKKHIVIKGATHTLTETKWKQTFSDATVRWFTDTLLT